MMQFQDWCCLLLMEQYADGGSLSLRFIDVEDKAGIARTTVNPRSFEIAADEVLIKNHFENSGLVEASVSGFV